jgi:prepilin-type N-terminal cleavage/methylation domain-containing protein
MTAQIGLGRADSGFTLIEAMIALTVLAVGLLSLAQAFAMGLAAIGSGALDVTARQKAVEAVESVYTARDTGTVTWDQIQNAADGGIFLDGPQPLAVAGPDGLVNTADDGAVETISLPGPDGDLGTADDIAQPLTQFTRSVVISDVSPNVRRVRVTIRLAVGGGQREFTVETLISAYA